MLLRTRFRSCGGRRCGLETDVRLRTAARIDIAAGVVGICFGSVRRNAIELLGVRGLRSRDAIKFSETLVITEQRLQVGRLRRGQLHLPGQYVELSASARIQPRFRQPDRFGRCFKILFRRLDQVAILNQVRGRLLNLELNLAHIVVISDFLLRQDRALLLDLSPGHTAVENRPGARHCRQPTF